MLITILIFIFNQARPILLWILLIPLLDLAIFIVVMVYSKTELDSVDEFVNWYALKKIKEEKK